jgi:hypothetical protein
MNNSNNKDNNRRQDTNGRYYKDDIKQLAISRLLSGDTVTKISQDLNIKKTTISSWKRRLKLTDKCNQVHIKRKEEFINDAWDIIKDGNELIKRKFKSALEGKDDVTVRELTTAVGILYDKQALALGESTENINAQMQLSDSDKKLLDNLAKRQS